MSPPSIGAKSAADHGRRLFAMYASSGSSPVRCGSASQAAVLQVAVARAREVA
jgi:hypothetical protein